MLDERKEALRNIIGGPDKEMLFVCCQHAYGDSVSITAKFKITGEAAIAQIVDAQICGIEHEDGSGHSFNLRGYCTAKLGSDVVPEPYKFEAYYNTATNDGCLYLVRR